MVGIQEYLNENGRSINIFGEPKFESFANALNTVLADFRPRISPEGMLICRIEEEHMWEARQLGDESPHVGSSRGFLTVIVIVGKSFLKPFYVFRTVSSVASLQTFLLVPSLADFHTAYLLT